MTTRLWVRGLGVVILDPRSLELSLAAAGGRESVLTGNGCEITRR